MLLATRLSSSIGLLVLIAIGAGCWHRADGHCANLAGDHTCAERGAGAFCDACAHADDGCSRERPAGDCHFAGPWEGSSGGSSSTSSTSSNGGAFAEETTLEPDPDSSATTGEEPGCVSNDDCSDPARPFCGTAGECVACDAEDVPENACESLGLPMCMNGVCGGCDPACGGNTPVCDSATATCICTEHEHCREHEEGGPACNLFTGECLPADAVVHVGPLHDFETLSEAVASFGAGVEGTIIVHDTVYDYNDALTIDGGQVVAFLAYEDSRPFWDNGEFPMERHLTVTDGTVLIDGLTLSQYLVVPPSASVLATGSESLVWIDRSQIINNIDGVQVENGAELVLRNSFIHVLDIGSVPAVEVNDASATILYSTVVKSVGDSIPALSCSSPVEVEIRNSIIGSSGGSVASELSCEGASVSIVNSVTEADVGALEPAWFTDFPNGDLHLSNAGAMVFDGIAVWQAGDPSTDIDGDPRLEVAGGHDYVGADVP